MVDFDQSKIEAQRLEYLKRKAALEEEKAKEAREKAERNAFFKAKVAAAYKPVLTRKPHLCASCRQTIEAGEEALRRTVTTGYGYPGDQYFMTIYNHAQGCPMEAQSH